MLGLAIGGHHTLVLLKKRLQTDPTENRDEIDFKADTRKVYKYFNHVYAWGWNDKGQLGDSRLSIGDPSTEITRNIKFYEQKYEKYYNETTGKTQLRLLFKNDYTFSVTWVGAGDDHCMAITRNGLVFSWGDNTMGQCGQGHRLLRIYEPKVIESLRDSDIVAASGSTGRQHSAIVSTEGVAYIWGANAYVNLKNFPKTLHFYEPSIIRCMENRRAIQVCCGSGFNIIRIGIECGVFVWGRNDYGQIGLQEVSKKVIEVPTFLPIEVSYGAKLHVEKVAIGTDYVVACLRGSTSEIFCWGYLQIFKEIKEEAKEEKKVSLMKINPFTMKAAIKKPGPKEDKIKKLEPENLSKIYNKVAVCKPTLVYHELWENENFLDITATLDEISVLSSYGNVYGMTYFQFGWKRNISQKHGGSSLKFEKRKSLGPDLGLVKEESKSFSEIVTGRECLCPILYSYRKLKPSCMQPVAINSAFSTISCGTILVRHAKAVSTKAKSSDTTKQENLFHTTTAGDVIPYPPQFIKKPVETFDKSLQMYSSTSEKPNINIYKPIPGTKNEDAKPDPNLIKNMKF